jgi:hypothetical protein
MEKSGGFDISDATMGTKIVGICGILLLVDSFFAWQKVCVDLGALGLGSRCAGASAWGGSGSGLGAIMGILLIILVIWEVVQLAGMAGNVNLPIAPSKGSAYLGFAVVVFGLLKFILVLTSDVKPSLFGWIGLVLILGIGYGSWMKFQEPETSAPPAAGAGGDTGGFTA